VDISIEANPFNPAIARKIYDLSFKHGEKEFDIKK